MLMPVQSRSPLRLRVIAMPHADVLQSHSPLQMLQRELPSILADDVIARYMNVTSINACCDRESSAQHFDEFRNLLKRAAQRILRTGSVLYQQGQSSLGQVQPFARLGDRNCRTLKPLFPACTAKRSRMQHQIFRAQSQRPFQLSAKRLHRFLQKGLVRSREIDEIVGVNHQRLQIILLPQAVHDFALAASKLIRTPLPRAGREDLKRIASQPVGSLGGVFYARRNRGMDPDSPRSPPLRPDRLRPLQRILFRRTKNSHPKILKDLSPYSHCSTEPKSRAPRLGGPLKPGVGLSGLVRLPEQSCPAFGGRGYSSISQNSAART